jgi:RNA polymerase sigma-70 factor (ECF subfamily)
MQSPKLAAARRARDAQLAARVIASPDDAIAEVWRRFRPLVRRILVKMLGTDEEVHDLSQEAFVQLYQSVRGLRSPEAIRSFVAGISVRLALQELRCRRVRGGQVLVPGQSLLPHHSINADPEAREAVARLLQLVGQLRETDQDIFMLRAIDGLEQTEISAATRMSVSTVRRRLRRLERRIEILVNNDPALADYAGRAGRRALRARGD